MQNQFTTSKKETDPQKRKLIEKVLAEASHVNELAKGKEIRLENADASVPQKKLKKILKQEDERRRPREDHVCSSGRRFR